MKKYLNMLPLNSALVLVRHERDVEGGIPEKVIGGITKESAGWLQRAIFGRILEEIVSSMKPLNLEKNF